LSPFIKLLQYSVKPSLEYFKAVQEAYKYIRDTVSDDIYYLTELPRNDLPIGTTPTTKDPNHYLPETRDQMDLTNVRATVDSDYANDTTHRKSFTGIIIRIAGGSIFYKTNFQSSVALNSIRAEFIAACETPKVIIYIRSILDDIHIRQDKASTLFEDNQDAILLVNSGQLTKQTFHIDTKYFALQNWVDLDLLTLRHINTADNESDLMKNNLRRTLFYRHM